MTLSPVLWFIPRTPHWITEFTDVFPRDGTLISPEITLMITEFVDVFPEDSLDKLPPKRDIQHAIEFDLE